MRKMIKNNAIFRNFIWNTVGSTLASFNSLFFLIAITRINGLEDAGIFSITVTTAGLLYIFAIYSGRNCHITDIKNQIKDKDYMASRVLTCIAMIIITIVVIFFCQYDIYQKWILLFLSLWKAIEAFVDVFYAILQKQDKLYVVGQSLVIKSILTIMLFILVDMVFKNLVIACMTLPVVSLMVLFIFDLPRILPNISKQEKVSSKNVYAIYKGEFFLFAGTFLTMYLMNAPKYAIEKYLNNEIQGIYGIILMPASILPLFAQFILAPTITMLTKSYKESKWRQMNQIEHIAIWFIIGFGMVSTMIGYFIGIPVLNTIYKVDLSIYRWDLVFILIAYVIYAIAFVKTTILTIYRNIKEQFAIYLLVGIIAWICSTVFIKQWQERGIIVAYLVIMGIYCLLATSTKYIQYRRKVRKNEIA